MEKHKSLILIDYAKSPPCSGLICACVCSMGVLEAGTNNKLQVIDAMSGTRWGVCANLCPAKAMVINQNKLKKDK